MNTLGTIGILNDLIATSEDGAKGFAEAANDATDPELRVILGQRAAACSHAVTELQNLAQSIGGIPEKTGTVAGAVHRGWVKIKSAVADNNIAVLEEVERGEDQARSIYEKALKCELPSPIHEAVQRQYLGTVRNHDLIRDLRNNFYHAESENN